MLRTLFILLGALGVGDTLVVSAYSTQACGCLCGQMPCRRIQKFPSLIWFQ